jgi:hypothetical protein
MSQRMPALSPIHQFFAAQRMSGFPSTQDAVSHRTSITFLKIITGYLQEKILITHYVAKKTALFMMETKR